MIVVVTKHAESLLPPIGGKKEFHLGQKGTTENAEDQI